MATKQVDPKQARRDAEARIKAARAAAKERKKNSTDPKDMGRMRQIQQAYKLTHEYDKPLPWLLAGAFVVPVIIAVVVGLLIDQLLWLIPLGLMVGLLLAMIVLVQRVKGATFKRYTGQAGSAEVALNMLPKTWSSTPVIAATKHKDVVHRALGPGGLVLVGEGDPGRVKQLLAAEARKHQRVTDRVEVITLQMGDKDGQIPLSRLTQHLRKLPKKLEPHQMTDIKSRLRALDAVRPRMPIPRGPMPTSAKQGMKGARQAMRGR